MAEEMYLQKPSDVSSEATLLSVACHTGCTTTEQQLVKPSSYHIQVPGGTV